MTDKHLAISEWPHDLTDEIRKELVGSNRTIVVFDDDPTGTQTVYDVPVLTVFDVESLTSVISQRPPLLFILTNSRAMTEAETESLHATLAERLRSVAESTGQNLELISRSDSTLRGHYPLEADTISNSWPEQSDLTLVMPFFAEGGRFTIDSQHYVCEGDRMLEAHHTPFAEDKVFGFQNSFMPAWVEEKTNGRVNASDVVIIPLATIRGDGPDGVQKILDRAEPGSICVADAAADSDAAVVAAAVGRSSRRIMARVAASYVRARSGLTRQPLLSSEQLAGDSSNGGLVMVGSHVPKTTAQLNHLLDANPELVSIELSIKEILLDPKSFRERVVATLDETLSSSKSVVVYTSRQLEVGNTDEENLKISSVVSSCVSGIVADLTARPRYLVAKGGITSSDIATKSLGVKLASVAGSILPGVPVWKLGDETKFPGMHYVIFPGNVGGDDALSQTVTKLDGGDA